MQTKIFAALTAAFGALALAAPAHAGGYWDGGNRAIYGGGWCPPPPPPPCDCPPRYGYARPQPYGEGPPPGYGSDYGYDQGLAYGDDEGFAPFDEGDEGVGGYYGPDYYGGGGGFVGGGPLVGVDVGFGFGDRDRFGRQRFFDRDRFDGDRFDRDRFDRDRFDRQRFDERGRFRPQPRVFERQHVQQHFVQQQRMMQPHQRSYGHAMGGRGRW